VLLAGGTTVLGVIPLLSDVFWVSMSVVIMFGLTLGAVITMVLLPRPTPCFLESGILPALGKAILGFELPKSPNE
jgi:hypothetical protein